MEQLCDTIQMLDLIVQPALCVKGGRIIKLNQAAQHLLLSPDGDINSLLLTGKEEYAAFEGGCLYLTMKIAGQSFGASVTRMATLNPLMILLRWGKCFPAGGVPGGYSLISAPDAATSS